MNTFAYDGVEACLSFLSQAAYKAAPCGLLLHVTPENQHAALDAFAESDDFSGLRIARTADLSFLARFPNLRYLEVVDQPRVNTRPLDALSNLRGLRLETPGTAVDFDCFPELEVFVGDWHKDNVNVHRCEELRQLRIWKFKPKSLDLQDLAGAPRLERLQLVQTGVVSLRGLESLEDLRYLEIARAQQLTSLDALATPGLELRELGIERARKIVSYEPLASLSRLRRLKLLGCAPMPNLAWTAGMNYLDSFSFVETNVEDGDLAPLLSLPRLRYAGMMDKRHHNYTFDALNELLMKRSVS